MEFMSNQERRMFGRPVLHLAPQAHEGGRHLVEQTDYGGVGLGQIRGTELAFEFRQLWQRKWQRSLGQMMFTCLPLVESNFRLGLSLMAPKGRLWQRL